MTAEEQHLAALLRETTAADAAPAAEEAKPEGVMGSVSDTMSEFAPHLDKIHWPEK